MGPLADLLIRLLAETDACLDIAHIPHRDPSDLVGLAEVHHRARRLMQDVMLLAVELGAHLGFALEQALGPARTGLTTAQLLLQHAVDLVAPLLAGAQLSSRDKERVPFARRHCRDVRLAQVDASDGSSGQRGRQRLPHLQRQAQLVVIRPPGPLLQRLVASAPSEASPAADAPNRPGSIQLSSKLSFLAGSPFEWRRR
jgi:hypothetical protein